MGTTVSLLCLPVKWNYVVIITSRFALLTHFDITIKNEVSRKLPDLSPEKRAAAVEIVVPVYETAVDAFYKAGGIYDTEDKSLIHRLKAAMLETYDQVKAAGVRERLVAIDPRLVQM